MPFFEFDNINFHYQCHGQGLALLFLHGLGGDLSQAAEMLEHTRGFKKIFMDVRAHGGTQPTGPLEKLGFEQFAKDAAALMHNLGVQKAIVGGISMGSATALRLALDAPEMVQALLLVRPAWLNKPNPENLAEAVIIGGLLAQHPAGQAKRIYSARPEFQRVKRSAPVLADSLLSNFDKPLAKERCPRLVRIPSSIPFGSMEDLARIHQPTLILATDNDPVHPSSIAQTIASTMPRSRLARVVAKSQDLHEHLCQCSQQINDFLDEFRCLDKPG